MNVSVDTVIVSRHRLGHTFAKAIRRYRFILPWVKIMHYSIQITTGVPLSDCVRKWVDDLRLNLVNVTVNPMDFTTIPRLTRAFYVSVTVLRRR